MERWKHLESVAVEFEEFGRSEEREKWTKHVTLLEAKLESALKRASDAEKSLERELQNNARLTKELARLSAMERELAKLGRRVVALNLSLLGGREGLFLACDQGDVQMASSFLEPVYNASEDDATIRQIQNEALRIAASGNFFDVCEMLVRRGADPADQDPRNGQMAIHRATSAPGQDDQILMLFLQDANTRIHINDTDASGATPLTLAVQLLRAERMMCLVSFGADASLVSREDWKRLNDHQAQQVYETASSRDASVSGGSFSSPSVASAKSSPGGVMTPDRRRGLFEVTNNHPSIVSESASKRRDGSPLSAKKKETAESLSEKAGELYRSERFDEAFQVYSSLEKLTGDWSKQNKATLYYNTARTAAKLNRHAEATDWCEKALSLDPTFIDALAQRADSKMQLFDFARAAIDYETLAQLSPEDAEDWLRLAERARVFLQRTENYYALLDIDPTCDTRAVHKAFLKKSLRWHPDKNRGSRDDETRANFMMKALTEAKSILEDPAKRIEYDTNRMQNDEFSREFEFEVDFESDDGGETFVKTSNNLHPDHVRAPSDFDDSEDDDDDGDDDEDDGHGNDEGEDDAENRTNARYGSNFASSHINKSAGRQPAPLYRSPRNASDMFRPVSSMMSSGYPRKSDSTSNHNRW